MKRIKHSTYNSYTNREVSNQIPSIQISNKHWYKFYAILRQTGHVIWRKSVIYCEVNNHILSGPMPTHITSQWRSRHLSLCWSNNVISHYKTAILVSRDGCTLRISWYWKPYEYTILVMTSREVKIFQRSFHLIARFMGALPDTPCSGQFLLSVWSR